AINGSKLLDQYDLSSLRFCISGGAPLPRTVQETFEALTGCTLVEGYGLTEAGPVCTINPFGGARPGSIGLPLPGTLVEITAIDDPDRRLAMGQRGEICISGPQVMAGYEGRPEETAEALRGGRLHTGDVGYIDQDGYVYLIDRIKDLILSAGFNVYPRMVEEAILLHPGVAEAIVCGVPDAHRGEIVKAYVRAHEGAVVTAAELRAFLRDKLAPFEQPKAIEIRDELPLTWLGKPSRRDLVAEEMHRLNQAAAQPTSVGPAAQPQPIPAA
ncbi:MAG TPA: AMP-binding protein, partial [Geminicoccaceae bacterium]